MGSVMVWKRGEKHFLCFNIILGLNYFLKTHFFTFLVTPAFPVFPLLLVE